MQARAIFEGAVEAGRKTGTPITAEIMLPVIFGRPEFDLVKPIIVAAAEAVAKETGVTVPYQVGTMIELPRAALRAGEIAESAEFFSFGTNDLTQTTLGVSRDDAASFLGSIHRQGAPQGRPVHDARHRRRRRTDQDRHRARQGDAARTSSSASAASMAAIPPRSPFARRRISTMSRARRSASRSPASPPPRRRWAERRIRRREQASATEGARVVDGQNEGPRIHGANRVEPAWAARERQSFRRFRRAGETPHSLRTRFRARLKPYGAVADQPYRRPIRPRSANWSCDGEVLCAGRIQVAAACSFRLPSFSPRSCNRRRPSLLARLG